MSRLKKWLFFFEESSERRDVESWSNAISANTQGFFKLKILGLVSDRAKALIKLGTKEYLNAFSMPDLFHFQQDIGNLCGLQIGRKNKTAKKSLSEENLKDKSAKEKEALIASANEVIEVYQEYKNKTEEINKTIHPFDESNNWAEGATVQKTLIEAVRKVSELAETLNINLDLSKASKVLCQIPVIALGITNWLTISQEKINTWLKDRVITEVEKIWFVTCLLPFVYWDLQLKRTKNGRTNPSLVDYYKNRMLEAQIATMEQVKLLVIPIERQNILFDMAYQMANSFQRSSSQVEGRNGYLAFIHHGQKGIPKRKMKALTIIHNFDITRPDGSTPAQRLFNREFPNLFEFLCDNVTGFKEPRKRKVKPLIINNLQR